MNVVAIIIGIVFFFYVLDLTICNIYCRMKKKKDILKFEQRDLNTQKENSSETIEIESSEVNKGIGWKIKQHLNGWMFYSVVRLGRIPCQAYRKFILKHIFQMDIAKNVVIYGGFCIRAPWNISIGKGTIIGDGCNLDGRNGLSIGENVNLSTGVYIYTEQHEVNDPYFRSGKSGGMVVIEDYAWISSRTTILPKVHVGKGAVLASGALAPKDLESFGIYAGVPAKKIGERSQDLRYEFDGSYLPFV